MKGREAVPFVACLLMLAALPWTVRYWPGEDDLNHVAIAHIVGHLHDAGSTFSSFFRGDLRPRPYPLHYYLLLGLAQIVPLLVAEKLVVSLVAIGLPLVGLWTLVRLAPSRWTNIYLLLPLWSYPPLLLRGLTNFVLGTALAIGTIPLLAVETPSRARILLASALFFLAMLAHPFACFVVGVVLVALHGRALFSLRQRSALVAWTRLLVVVAPAAALLAVAAVENHLRRADLPVVGPLVSVHRLATEFG